MSAAAYFEKAQEALKKVATEQAASIRQAAGMLVDAIANDNSIFGFGASHSFMVVEEMVYRTGGLMLINPVYPQGMNLLVRPTTLTSQLERLEGLGQTLLEGASVQPGDVLIVASTSGRNAVAIDIAAHARELGLRTIGITSFDYTNGVTSRHSSGKKLINICDVVIDNGAPYGDACVEVEGFADKVGPLSSVTACAVVNALVSEVVAILVERGVDPPVYMSANVDGGDEHNARLLEANRHRIHYL